MMSGRYKYIFLTILTIGSYGCATIINGKSQYLPVQVPDGTTITDIEGVHYPLIRLAPHGDTNTYIRLLRKRDHVLKFTYRGTEIEGFAPRKFEIGWLGMDLLFFPGLIVDLVTGAWHSFDGIKVDYTEDTTSPIYTLFEPTDKQSTHIGGRLTSGFGRVIPSDVFPILPNEWFGGASYRVSPAAGCGIFIGEYSANPQLSDNTIYFDILTNIFTFHLEGYYHISDEAYALIGGGMTHFGVNSLSYRSAQMQQTIVDSVGFSKQIGSAEVGVGYESNEWFIELKHMFGLSSIMFPNGDHGYLQATSITFGFIAHF